MTRPVGLIPLAALLAAAVSPGCRTPRPPAPLPAWEVQLRKESAAGYAAFGRGDMPAAVRRYREALRMAQTADEAGRIADTAYHLGAALLAAGSPGAALPYLREARAEFARAGRPGLDAMLVEAQALRGLGRQGAASALAGEVLDDASVRPDQMVSALALKADAALDAGEAQTAASWVAQLAGAAETAGDILSRATAHRCAGRLAEAEGRSADAAAAYDREADVLQQADSHHAMAAARGRAAAAYRAAGRIAEAVDRGCRSARSLLAQGQSAAALQSLDTVRQALEADADARERYQGWYDRLAAQAGALHAPP